MSPDSWTKNPIEKPLRATEASLEHRLTGLQKVIGKLEDRVKELEKKFSFGLGFLHVGKLEDRVKELEKKFSVEALEDKTSRV